MWITVIGTGYVGLVTGACLSQWHEVTCVDIDEEKIASLQAGKIPFYEPGLEVHMRTGLETESLRFTTDVQSAIKNAYVIFICVGTPTASDGHADLSAVWNVAYSINEFASTPKIIVTKSTVPPGTNAMIHFIVNAGGKKHHVASNPEFLREGSAVQDFLYPDRVIIGTDSADAEKALVSIYKEFTTSPILTMGLVDAEMSKYVANCFLATKISFINEMADLCELLGADIRNIQKGIGHDSRIGFESLSPGMGYGGSCFPKDVAALCAIASTKEKPSKLLEAVEQINENRIELILNKLTYVLTSHLEGRTVAILGLAFKPHTDDIREAPAIALIDMLLAEKVNIRVHDPIAMENVKAIYGDKLTYCKAACKAAENADALVIATEWPIFWFIDWVTIKQNMATPNIIDGRNLLDKETMEGYGFTYQGTGY